ncbi:MAG TPA: TIGR03435 family protein [Acidobacteriaceae bacterium]|nr:TIGR03435 family protein [Acidobacteriaceae bacterium]
MLKAMSAGCCVVLMVPLLTWWSAALAQTTAPAEAATPAPEKAWKFEVVSIRRDTAGGPQYIGRPTADGYQMKNLFLGYLIFMAYAPHTGAAAVYGTDQIVGMPAWLTGDDDHYDVDAKISPEDMADWQNPVKQPAMLQPMLQAMLAERLKLVVHRSTKEAPVYLLAIGKNGLKFKRTNPDALHSDARTMPGGGYLSREEEGGQMMVHYFDISMGQLARYLARSGRSKIGPVWTGRYDVTVHRPLPPATQPDGSSGTGATDPGPDAGSIAEQLGLRLQPEKAQVETLVIDHVEKPTEN